MLDRMSAGALPEKPHVVFRDSGGPLLYEHCITREGFDGAFTIAYRKHRPHAQVWVTSPIELHAIEPSPRSRLRRRCYRALELAPLGGSPTAAAVPLLFNRDVVVSVASPSESDPYYVSYAEADALYFVLEGGGTLRSELGDVPFEALDYLFVPKGVIHRFLVAGPQRLLRIDCARGFGLLRRHRNALGQLRMDAPYSHRDFRRPRFEGPIDEGIRELVVVRRDGPHVFKYARSPLDVVGWDGVVYPWAFPILRFAPRVGMVHLPPDAHGTFEGENVLVSSFVPRPLDFHPEAVPCPYPHSSVDCDEAIFYARGELTSRRGIDVGSVSLHPAGIPHGPHPGAYEDSVGRTSTEELAVMLDVFSPLRPTVHADAVEDTAYHQAFAGGDEA